MATVLAIGYLDEAAAAQAAREVRRLSDELLIQPDAMATIARDVHGEYRVATRHHPVADGASWGMFWPLLFGLLFFVPVFGTAVGASLGGLFGKIEKCGIDRAFQQQARDMVRPGTSALFVVASQVSPESVFAALGRFGGTALESSLTQQQEARLQQALYGSLSATVA